MGEDFSLVYEIEPQGVLVSLNWESTYEDIATVSDGLVRALKPGTTKISVSIDGTDLYDVCTVNVKGNNTTDNDETNDDAHIKMCGGNIIVTSSILSSISLLFIGLIYLSRLLRNKNEKK